MRTFCVLLALACTAVSLSAEHPARRAPTDIPVREIDLEEGKARLQHFRSQRLAGDFAFHFELRHTPRRGKTVTYLGKMWGSWNEEGPITRVELKAESALIQLLIQSGPNPRVWRVVSGEVQELSSEAMLEPIIPETLFSAYDLVMPFAYWEDFTYEGSRQTQGRPAYIFRMHPPAAIASAEPDLGDVRIALDTHFNALLKAEWLDDNGGKVRSFRMLSFKKVSDAWIVKTIDLVDEKNRDKTRFQVKSAALDLQLDASRYFTPASLLEGTGQVFEGFFETL